MRENYGLVDSASVELRTADALVPDTDTPVLPEDDEEKQFKRDIIEAML
jgi:hypothetical protein